MTGFRFSFVVLLATLVVLVVVPSSALAEAPGTGTGWEAFAQSYPTNLHPGGKGRVVIDVMNTGATRSSGAITVSDVLPEGLVATAAGGEAPNHSVEVGGRWVCGGLGGRDVSCTSDPEVLKGIPSGVDRSFLEKVLVEVKVAAGAPEGPVQNVVTVGGGGARHQSVVNGQFTLSSSESGFGVSGWDVLFSNADGSVATRAGSHPYEMTVALGFDSGAVSGETFAGPTGGEVRTVEAELPAGFFGEPNSTPRCDRQQLDEETCPADSQIGVDFAEIYAGEVTLPVYNMAPVPGVADEIGLKLFGIPTYFDTSPRGFGGYNLVTHVDDIPAIAITSNVLQLWGVPSEHGTGAPARPFLTLPTSCGVPSSVTVRAEAWGGESAPPAVASVATHDLFDEPVVGTGCSSLSFDPSLTAAPETGAADTPAGLAVKVGFPEEELREPSGLVESTLKNTTVTLPEGLVINPGQAAGLQACTEAQSKLKEEGAPACPAASKVGTVKVKTPLLEGAIESELEGGVYVLQQSHGGEGEPANLQSSPPALQLLIAISGDGINLKLVANVQLNPSTGQLTTTVSETPGIPFTSFELHFSGGEQAALATPTQCGLYTTTSDFTPWSSPSTADAFPTSSFQVTSGPGGGPCPSNPLPFSPELIAGSTTDEAGAFTNFTLLLQRGDAQQRIEKLQFKAPQGLSAMLSGVTLCPEPQAQEGTCGGASRIGHTSVASGPGRDPLVLPGPGNPEFPIYLTGPYGGAPFGLSIVTPIVAGPFNLGTIVTRAKVEIDPVTAQITVTTQPLPQIIDGVPTDLRLINSVIDRPGFMFNPTNCNPQEFTGTAWGADPAGQPPTGTTAAVSSHFGIGSCRSLQFKPSIAVSTAGKASKVNGASLSFKIAYPKGAQGSESWMKEMKFEIPKQLPARLTTIQKACLAATFEHNRAACPPASVIGHVLVHTPVLPVPLEGQLYFVSYGGAAFPDAVAVIKGYGITIESHGHTFIDSKTGVTSATFETIPDVPFESIEVTVPQGPFSEFGANLPKGSQSFCGQKLVMPVLFKAQNGAETNQNVPVAVTGCPKTLTRAQKLAAALKACKKKQTAWKTNRSLSDSKFERRLKN